MRSKKKKSRSSHPASESLSGSPSGSPKTARPPSLRPHPAKKENNTLLVIKREAAPTAVAAPEKASARVGKKAIEGGSSSARSGRGKKAPKQVLRATVDKNRRGFAFLIFDQKLREDEYLTQEEARALFPGDRVEVLMKDRRVVDWRLVERRLKEVVGRFSFEKGVSFLEGDGAGGGEGASRPSSMSRGGGRGGSGRAGKKQKKATRVGQGWVILERKKIFESIFLADVPESTQKGDWLRVKLSFATSGKQGAKASGGAGGVTGEILENYGAQLPAKADLWMVAAEFGLQEAPSQQATEEARQLKRQLLAPQDFGSGERSSSSSSSRRDLKHLPFITIDGETARDFDDAIFVERKDQHFDLWVAIADVSFFVTPGSLLDEEARRRGTSVYFPERAFHMLPTALSEDLCSLKPGVERFVLVAKISLDFKGVRLKTEMMEAVIVSHRRATYLEIQAEWEAQKNLVVLAPLYDLFAILRQMRLQRGSIDFELPEAEVRVDAQGEVITIQQSKRVASHRLIEEFMIAANEASTDWMVEKNWPFLFRVHEKPTSEALKKFQDLAATVGLQFGADEWETPLGFSRFLQTLEGHPAQGLMNLSLLRSMKQAIYSPDPGGHFGLASLGYTHFTSPIRRYPDLVVHRLIRKVLQGEPRPQGEAFEKDLRDICDHCSFQERLSAEAEREALRIKQVRLALRYLGGVFPAKIVGLVSSGFFVHVLDPYIEGRVALESIEHDAFVFDEVKMVLRGRKSGQVFRMGDTVEVQVVRADLDRRQIDFQLQASETVSREKAAAAKLAQKVASRREGSS